MSSLGISSLIGAYLLGALPVSKRIARYYGVDLSQGSGNYGTTNMYRLGGWQPACLLLAWDSLKTAVPTLMSLTLWPGNAWMPILIGSSGILGHILPPTGKGGKGVAPTLGVLAVLAPLVLTLVLLVCGGILAKTRYMSLASLTGAVLAPALAYVLALPMPTALAIAVISLSIIGRHYTNIYRLYTGTEHKLGPR